MAMNTLEMAGFSTEKYWIFSFQESSGYTNSTENTAKVLSEKMDILNIICGENATKNPISLVAIDAARTQSYLLSIFDSQQSDAHDTHHLSCH